MEQAHEIETAYHEAVLVMILALVMFALPPQLA